MNPTILTEYDEQIKNYYDERTAGKRVEGWSEQIARGLGRTSRLLKSIFRKTTFKSKIKERYGALR